MIQNQILVSKTLYARRFTFSSQDTLKKKNYRVAEKIDLLV